MSRPEPRVLQLCHGYDGPFLDCARQYAALFAGSEYKVTTVYLTGAPSAEVEAGSASDEVIFLDYSSREVRGLKLKAIRDIRRIVAGRDFKLCIAHRFKPIYISLLACKLPQDAWVVGNVGRLHPDKDQATLIRGFAQALPQLPAGSLLAIMGSGRLEAELKALAVELGMATSVRFLGQVPNARRYFKAFDAFVLSSDHEPFGMVLLEAMAAGVPLICSDCGGGREVVEGVGVLFPLRDIASLAQSLVHTSRLTANELGETRNSLAGHLQSLFVDEAGAARFWQLPLLKSVAN